MSTIPPINNPRLSKHPNLLDWVLFNSTQGCYHIRDIATARFSTKAHDLKSVREILSLIGFEKQLETYVNKDSPSVKGCVVIHDIVYAPFRPELYVDADQITYLNTWVDHGFEPAPNPWPNTRRLLDRMCGTAEGVEWVLDLLAYQIQNPFNPTGISAFFASRPGLGKDTLYHLLTLIHGQTNTVLLPPERLGQRFNNDIANKTLICANEVIDLNESREQLQEILKSYITSRTLTLEVKYQDAREVPNRALWLFFTNRPESIALQPDDRRFSVFHSKEENLKAGWTKFVADFFWTPTPGSPPGLSPAAIEEARGLYHDLLARDVSKFVLAPFENQARAALLEQGESTFSRFVKDFLERGLEDLIQEYGQTTGFTTDDRMYDLATGVISKKLLFTYYRQSCKDMGMQPVKLPRFNRQILETFGPQAEVRASLQGRRAVRCFKFDPATKELE